MKKVVVVAPTFNEAESIEKFIAQVLAQRNSLPEYELKLLNSASQSKDKTADIVKKIAVKDKNIVYLDVLERGLGLGLVKGLNYAVEKMGADVLVTMEADLSNDPSEIAQFVKKTEKFDVVIGSRYIEGGMIANWSWWRRAASQAANYILMFLAWTSRLHEFTNLYRAFTKEVWEGVKPNIKIHKGWLFVPAFAFEVLGSQYKVAEIPIIYFDRFGGRSKMRTFSYTKDLLRYALRFRFKKMFG